jgi:hypothetical protein
MNREELAASWERTRSHLARAAALLPHPVIESQEGGFLSAYSDFLEHNELGLAFDELRALGSINAVTKEYWAALVAAAIEMKLADAVAELRARAGAG